MTQLSDLLGSPRTDILPDYQLSPARLKQFGLMEREFSRVHILTAATAAASVPESIGDRLISAASKDVADGKFVYGARGFDARMYSPSWLPFALWTVLQINKPDMTQEQAAALITPENESTLHSAILTCFGYRTPTKAEPADSQKKSNSQSPPLGPESSPPSAAADSPTAISPT